MKSIVRPSRITRRGLLRSAGMSVAAAVLPGRSAGAQKRPNFLFILTDDQRKDTIGAYGNPHIRTPNLDRLVRSGVRFTSAYCMGGYSGAVCLPARQMLLRGRSWFSVRNLPAGFPNLPGTLNEAGYVTYFMGKKGNSDQQVQRQFTYSSYLEPGDKEVREAGRPDRALADAAIEFLRRWKSDPATSKGRPFFMYLAGASPHDPRVAPKEHLDRYDPARIPLPPNYRPFHPFDNGDLLVRDERLAGWPRPEAEIRSHLRDYYAVVSAQDEQFGRIFQALRDTGESENTYVIFSSDQGIAIGSHGLMGKQNLYEHSMGVPLIVAGPGIPRNQTSGALCYHFDIFPTVCDLAGIRIPPSLEGRSLAPVLRGKGEAVRDTVFLAYKDVQRAVRRGRWKLIRYPQTGRNQLFDLQSDPHESNDVSGDPAQAARIGELLETMRQQQKLFGDPDPLTVAGAKGGAVGPEFFREPYTVRPYR